MIGSFAGHDTRLAVAAEVRSGDAPIGGGELLPETWQPEARANVATARPTPARHRNRREADLMRMQTKFRAAGRC